MSENSNNINTQNIFNTTKAGLSEEPLDMLKRFPSLASLADVLESFDRDENQRLEAITESISEKEIRRSQALADLEKQNADLLQKEAEIQLKRNELVELDNTEESIKLQKEQLQKQKEALAAGKEEASEEELITQFKMSPEYIEILENGIKSAKDGVSAVAEFIALQEQQKIEEEIAAKEQAKKDAEEKHKNDLEKSWKNFIEKRNKRRKLREDEKDYIAAAYKDIAAGGAEKEYLRAFHRDPKFIKQKFEEVYKSGQDSGAGSIVRMIKDPKNPKAEKSDTLFVNTGINVFIDRPAGSKAALTTEEAVLIVKGAYANGWKNVRTSGTFEERVMIQTVAQAMGFSVSNRLHYLNQSQKDVESNTKEEVEKIIKENRAFRIDIATGKIIKEQEKDSVAETPVAETPAEQVTTAAPLILPETTEKTSSVAQEPEQNPVPETAPSPVTVTDTEPKAITKEEKAESLAEKLSAPLENGKSLLYNSLESYLYTFLETFKIEVGTLTAQIGRQPERAETLKAMPEQTKEFEVLQAFKDNFKAVEASEISLKRLCAAAVELGITREYLDEFRDNYTDITGNRKYMHADTKMSEFFKKTEEIRKGMTV